MAGAMAGAVVAGSYPGIPSHGSVVASSTRSLDAERREAIEALRFMWAMVAASAGILEIVGFEIGPAGIRVTCRRNGSDTLIRVTRSRPWTDEEERSYAALLDDVLRELEVVPAPGARAIG